MSAASAHVKLNKYTPLVVLGRGGMGTVYLAVARGPGGFNKLQVVKYLKPELSEDEEFLKMFMDEARLSASINHPNVVQTNEVGQDGEQFYIAMEYVEGKTLLSVLGKGKKLRPMPLGMHLRVLSETLTGLHCAHELHDIDGNPLQVVHRDVSPQNVMVSFDGHVKVLDFGIAKAANSSSETRTGVLKGKFGYMAPEQMLGTGVDRRSDVFSAGVMLWQALTNERLWKIGTTDMEIFSRVTTGQIPKPSEVTTVDPELERICMRAMSFLPDERYATAEALQKDIDAWLRANNDHTTSRDISEYLNEIYGDDRKRVKGIIEDRLRAVRAGDAVPDSIPSFDLSSGTESGARSAERSGSTSLGSSAAMAGSTPAPAQKSRAGTVVLLGVGLAVAAGIAFAVMQKDKSAQQAAPPPPAPTVAAASTTTELRFALTPPTAAVLLDDKPVELIDGVATLPRDSDAHTIRIEAPGYMPATQPIRLDTARAFVSLALQKTPAAVPTSSAAVAVTTPPGGRNTAGLRTRGGPTPTAAEPPPPSTPSTPKTAAPSAAPTPTEARTSKPKTSLDPWN